MIDAAAVRSQLDRVLASDVFRSSRRCQNLLRHVTEHTLAGDLASLKERTLGAVVFGRVPDYDTNSDTVVRTTAGEVRKKLAQYYQTPGREGELRISLPAGSYVAEFHYVEAPPVTPTRRWKPWLIPACAGLAVALILAAMLLVRPAESVVEQFWRPMLDVPGDVLFCLGLQRAYNFRSDEKQIQFDSMLQQSPASLPAAIPTNQIIAIDDRYVALGDTMALVNLAGFLEKHSKPYRIRGVNSTTFADLREQPSVLIGAFDNEWTLRSVGHLRYTFQRTFVDGNEIAMVRDRDHPEKTDWKLAGFWPDWNSISTDYAIVSRVLDVNTERMTVITAGITHFGTVGGGEFLTTPAYMAEAIPQLPRGWQRRNVQIVLRIPVVRGASGRPHVLATYVW